MNPAIFSALVASTSARQVETAPVTPLAWKSKPPATGALNADITASWGGGVPPYRAVMQSDSLIINDQTGSDTTLTVNLDGTNQPAGLYHWTITDGSGAVITADTQVA